MRCNAAEAFLVLWASINHEWEERLPLMEVSLYGKMEKKGNAMLIEKDLSLKNRLKDKVVLLTGAGGGIGFRNGKSIQLYGSKSYYS